MTATNPPLLTVAATIGAAKIKFVLDTGSSITILPKCYANGIFMNDTNVKLSSASGQQIKCYGEATLNLKICELRREFTWQFFIADVTHPLLGMDFLSHFDLMIDCKNKKLLDKTTKLAAKTENCNIKVMSIDIEYPKNLNRNVKILLEKYSSLISAKSVNPPKKRKVFHRIDTGENQPVHCKRRYLPPDKLEAAKEEFKKLMAAGIVQQSESTWSSPLHLVQKKKPGEWRPCGDYRSLNSITKPDRYPVPLLKSVSSSLHNKKVFSKIDLSRAYHQIPVHPDDVPKTAISTPFGMFEFLFMPFGLRNAGSTFQRFIDNAFLNCECTFIYLDDILIFSESEEQHMKDLETVFKILSDYDLRIALDKCQFVSSEIDFLGFTISSKGLTPTSEKSETISNFPEPNSSEKVRKFLGMINYYRHLIANFAEIALPLTELIKNNPNSKNLTFSNECKQAFQALKSKLANVTALSHPIPGISNFQLVTDASQFAVGAALHQMVDNKPIPIGFFSKKLSQTQVRYSTFDRELLAAYMAVLHFRPYIEGRNVTLFTDHKPLKSAFVSKNPAKSDKQQRYLSLLTEYITDVQYIKGNENIVADCLSRSTNAVSVDPYDLPAIAAAQDTDDEISQYQEKLQKFPMKDFNLFCNVSTMYPRPFVPLSLRKSIFQDFHDLCHPGIKGSLKLIKSRFYWPDMDRNIRDWCKNCISCQESKVHYHTKSKLQEFNLPSERFQTVHIDIVGPLPAVKQHCETFNSPCRYLLTCIDRCTRWIEAIPIAEITASTVATAFLNVWIARFGVPLHVVTDRGTQFESELFLELSKLVGFHRVRTTAYHPQTNGCIERAHRTIKTAITSRKQSWLDALPVVLLGIRSIPNETGYSPFTAVTGSSILIPKHMIINEEDSFTNEKIKFLAEEMSKLNFQDFKRHFNQTKTKNYVPEDLMKSSHVWLRIDRVRKPLEAPYTGPYKVLKRFDKFFVIEKTIGSGETVSIDRLKPAFVSSSSVPENNISLPSRTLVSKSQDNSPVPSLPQPYKTTSSGRKVTFNRRPDFVYY